MCQYAEYLNSTGIYHVDPFELEDIELLRTSSILRYATHRQGQPQPQGSQPDTPAAARRATDPFINAQFPLAQPPPTPHAYKNHGRAGSQ
jgi:hypothetical protein